jgi:hypothetical protein
MLCVQAPELTPYARKVIEIANTKYLQKNGLRGTVAISRFHGQEIVSNSAVLWWFRGLGIFRKMVLRD